MTTEDDAKIYLKDSLNVSRETMEDLQKLIDLLVKWNKTINLVGKSTIDEVWSRHILDSAQLWRFRPEKLETWVDLGSGGGFPGLVMAILGKHEAPHVVFHMVESDVRKCSFLKNVSRETSLNAKIHANRIEECDLFTADVVTARALAPVEKLLELSHRFLADKAFCLFLKGQACDTEVKTAHESWRFNSETTKSYSDSTGVILKLWNIKRV